MKLGPLQTDYFILALMLSSLFERCDACSQKVEEKTVRLFLPHCSRRVFSIFIIFCTLLRFLPLPSIFPPLSEFFEQKTEEEENEVAFFRSPRGRLQSAFHLLGLSSTVPPWYGYPGPLGYLAPGHLGICMAPSIKPICLDIANIAGHFAIIAVKGLRQPGAT